MNSYNFQISDKFLASPTEIRHCGPSTTCVGARWKLRKMVQVPYPEPSYSFQDHSVTERRLRVVKVPYPQPEQCLPDASAPDPLPESRESSLGWDSGVSWGNFRPHAIASPWSEPRSGSSVEISASAIGRNP